MTLQEIFNRVWERAKDEVRATSDYGQCMYRAPNGKACFIGVLIPDDKYKPEYDEDPCFSVVLQDLGIHMSLADACSSLQHIHDFSSPFMWRIELRNFAHSHKLTVPNT